MQDPPLREFRDDERDVVVLLVRAEALDFVDNGSEQFLRRKGAMAAKRCDKALFAKFFAGGVEGFGDAIGIESQSVARAKIRFADGAIPILEDAKDRGGGFEPFERIVSTEKKRGKMAAVAVTKSSGGFVVLGKKERGESSIRRVLTKKLIDGT